MNLSVLMVRSFLCCLLSQGFEWKKEKTPDEQIYDVVICAERLSCKVFINRKGN